MPAKTIVKSNGVVCFLDLLGAKGGWRKADNMIAVWDKLFDSLNDLAHYVKTKFGTDVSSYSFSDTIVITAPFDQSDKRETFYNLTGLIAFMLPEFFSARLLLRGCISIGDYYTSNARRMLIGPTIDEAVQYHALAEWAGVSLAPSAHLFVAENPIPNAHWGMLRYPIPLKGHVETDGIALKWVDVDKPDDAKKIREILTDELRNSGDVTVSLKLRNTINFFDHVMKEANSKSEVSCEPKKT
jgi:hypothetical protein